MVRSERRQPIQRKRSHVDLCELRERCLRRKERRVERGLGEGAGEAEGYSLGAAALSQVVVDERDRSRHGRAAYEIEPDMREAPGRPREGDAQALVRSVLQQRCERMHL